MLWLWESSRGDRKLSTWARLLEDCRDRAVRIYVETHGRLYDMANSRDWRTLADDGMDNEAETTRPPSGAAGDDRQRHGREGPRPVPYGYQREYMIDPARERVLVGQVPRDRGAGRGRHLRRHRGRVPLLAITRRLNAQGVPTRTGAKWSMTQVRTIAMNRAYIGQRVHDPAGRRAGSAGPARAPPGIRPHGRRWWARTCSGRCSAS